MRRGIKSASKLTVAAGLVVSVLLIIGPAGAGSATIAAGHPGTIPQGATELSFRVEGCDGVPLLQGVDGVVIDLGSNTHFSVSGPSGLGAPYSLNIAFYRHGTPCGSTGSYLTSPTTPVLKSWGPAAVPANSRWAVVSAAYGANILLTWNAYTPAP